MRDKYIDLLNNNSISIDTLIKEFVTNRDDKNFISKYYYTIIRVPGLQDTIYNNLKERLLIKYEINSVHDYRGRIIKYI